MKLGDFCLNVVHFLRSKICCQRLSCQLYSTVVRFVRLIRLWLYIRNFRSCQSAAMHLLCHNHTFLDPLFTAYLQHCPFSSIQLLSHSLTAFYEAFDCIYSKHIHSLITSWAETAHLRYLHPRKTYNNSSHEHPAARPRPIHRHSWCNAA